MALIVGWMPVLQGNDWPRFRGQGGLGFGKHASIPIALNETSAIWEIPTNGTGHSSPVIAGKQLYYTVTPAGKQKVRDLVCVSTNDGSEEWRRSFTFSEYVLHQFNSPSSTSPTVDSERVYIWWNDGDSSQVLAFSHEGDPVWKVDLGAFDSQWGCGSSVVLADDVLIVQKENLNEESFIVGLQPATGNVLWKTPVPAKSKTPYVTPVIRDTDKGKEAIFASTDHGLFSLDTGTGDFRWKFDPGFDERCVASPVVAGDYIFASCGAGGGGRESVVVQAPPGAEKATEAYRITRQLPYVPTGLGIEGRLYLMSDGGVGTCYEAKTGQLLWRERVLGKCFASLIAVDDRIYAFGRDGDYKVYRAAPQFELLGQGEFTAGIHATPAVSDGKLFVRTDEKIFCFQDGPKA